MRGKTLWILALGVVGTAHAQDQDLGSMGIEDLMKLQVTTASRQEQSFMNVPAAIYVVTGDDIRKSGAATVPDMLRMVPGLQVFVVDGNKWSVSIRGFGSRYANKLQVLVDGRSIYTPLFSGVYWDSNLLSPDEIERIEVIRGPGGALWGANAVNGIINIITRAAKDTQGGRAAVGFGDVNTANHRIRYGGQAGEKTFYRVYARYLGFANLDSVDGTKNNDGWTALHGGARLDTTLNERDTLTVSARLAHSSLHQFVPVQSFDPPYGTLAKDSTSASEWSLTADWRHQQSDHSESSIQFAYTGMDRAGLDVSSRTSVLDLGYQSTVDSAGGSRLLWGVGGRRYADQVPPHQLYSMQDENHEDMVWSAFAHYEKQLGAKTRLALGSTVEHNQYTGWEFQPSISVLTNASSRETYWVSASRAVRTPSRADDNLLLSYSVGPGEGVPNQVLILGSHDFKSETLVALEAGARIRPSANLFLDFTAFVNSYDNLRSFEAGTPYLEMSPVPHSVTPFTFANKLQGTTAGIEAAMAYQPHANWKLDVSASYFSDRFRLDADSTDPFGSESNDRQGQTPRAQFAVRSSHVLGKGLNAEGQFVYSTSRPAVPLAELSHLNLRLNWKPTDRVELSVFGNNLFSPKRQQADRYLFETLSAPGPSFGVQAAFKF